MTEAPLLADATPGDELPPRRHAVDQLLIDRYAAVSGDHNPLHTDPVFAKTTPYGRNIAHGMMTLAFVSDAMQAWSGRAWARSGTLDTTFIAPVFPGDEVTIAGRLVARDASVCDCAIECKVGERLFAVAQAKVTIEAQSHG